MQGGGGQEGAEGAGAGRRGQVREREGGARGGEGKGMHAIWIEAGGGASMQAGQKQGTLAGARSMWPLCKLGRGRGQEDFFIIFILRSTYLGLRLLHGGHQDHCQLGKGSGLLLLHCQ